MSTQRCRARAPIGPKAGLSLPQIHRRASGEKDARIHALQGTGVSIGTPGRCSDAKGTRRRHGRFLRHQPLKVLRTMDGKVPYPLWIKVPYLAFVLVLVPVYLRQYGP